MKENLSKEAQKAFFLAEVTMGLKSGSYVAEEGKVYYYNVPHEKEQKAAVATIDNNGKISPTQEGIKEFKELLEKIDAKDSEIFNALIQDGILTEKGYEFNEANRYKADPLTILKQCDIGCDFSKKVIGNFSVEDKETTGKFYAVLEAELHKIANGRGEKTYIFPDERMKFLEDILSKKDDGIYYCEAKILDMGGKLTQMGKAVSQLMLNSVSDQIGKEEVDILYKVDCKEIYRDELNEAIANANEVKEKLNSAFETMKDAGINNDGVYYGNNDNGEPELE